MLAPLVLPALSTNTATAVIVIAISPTCARVRCSPNIGTAMITMSTGVIAPMSTALASDVSWNETNASVWASVHAMPPAIDAFITLQVRGALASRAITSMTGTAIQYRTAMIVSGDASIARTNSGPMPQRTVTTSTAA